MPGPPGREDHGPGRDDLAVLQAHAPDARVPRGQVLHGGVLDHPDARVGVHGARERGGHVASGLVAAGVDHAGERVGPLPGEREGIARAVEAHAEALQFGDQTGRIPADGPRRPGIAHPCAGVEGVPHVAINGITGPDGRGNAPLCPLGAALAQCRLGDDDHGDAAREAQCRRHAGQPAADHHGRGLRSDFASY